MKRPQVAKLALYVSVALLASPCLAQSALQVSGIGLKPTTIDAGRFASLPHQAITVTNGHTHAQEKYSGVLLTELLAQAGASALHINGKAASQYLLFSASDGYRVVLSLGEVAGDFHPGTVLVADTVDGKPVPAKEGPFKLVVSEDKMPARWIHSLTSITLKQAE